MLFGGFIVFFGIVECLKKEIIIFVFSFVKVKIIVLFDREYLVWFGGLFLVFIFIFKDIWISKEEYDEYGFCIVYKKCF